jgi:hypothetical protein
MANSKRTTGRIKRGQFGDKPTTQTATEKRPKEIFEQLIAKANNLPSDLSTKKFRVLTEK